MYGLVVRLPSLLFSPSAAAFSAAAALSVAFSGPLSAPDAADGADCAASLSAAGLAGLVGLATPSFSILISSSSTVASSSRPSSTSPPVAPAPPSRQHELTVTSRASGASSERASMLPAAVTDAMAACSAAERSPLVRAMRAVPMSVRSVRTTCSLTPISPSPRSRLVSELLRGTVAFTRDFRGPSVASELESVLPCAGSGESLGEWRGECFVIILSRASFVIGLVR
mmetsp:Transcript_22441/g.53258  ORF Transcript_22441/g.53258 Transcript_22441/m.53258 type:complete len:227 (+) Transcript_22441:2992-3672(+)